MISSLGWVEKGGFVRCDLQSNESQQYEIGGDYLRLYAIDDERFGLGAHFRDSSRLQLSVRRFADPANSLWTLNLSLHGQETRGKPELAGGMHRFHAEYLKGQMQSRFVLVRVSTDYINAHLGDLPWFTNDEYDLGYQALIDCIPLPGSEDLLISIQRSSTIEVHDPRIGKRIDRIRLGERRGNPRLHILNSELWTIDNDTFVRWDLTTERSCVANALRLRPDL